MIRLLFICFFSLLVVNCYAQKPNPKKEKNLIQIQTAYTLETINLTKNAVGFSAPVSARAFAYMYLGMYEANKQVFPVSGVQLNQLNEYVPYESKVVPVNKEAFVNNVVFGLCKHFYRSMSPFNKEKLTILHYSFRQKFGKASVSDSLQAQKLVDHILEYAKKDGADAYLKNYPEDYVAPNCKSCWTKTTPGFFPALLPNYGKTRLFFDSTKIVIKDLKPIEFSTDSTSELYKEALEIVTFTKEGNKEAELIAEYWDDSPGYSGTPPGHLLSLTQQLFTEKKVDLLTRLNCLLTMTLAMQDAFILCWEVKYTTNFIRPITYIQQYIDPKFNSFIATPSFPEFTSGHSFQSGTAVTILAKFLPDCKNFSDKTNVKRTDINGAPRTYSDFESMGKEISISRFYGGIHFKSTLDVSFKAGQNLADLYLKSILVNE
jgi:PAP2 superfamily